MPQPAQLRSPTAAINSAHAPIPSPPRPNPHSPRGTLLHTSRGFLPCRLSNAGPRVCRHRRRGPASETLHKIHRLGDLAGASALPLAVDELVQRREQSKSANFFREHLQQVRNSAGNFENCPVQDSRYWPAREHSRTVPVPSLLLPSARMHRLPPEPRASASRFLARSKRSRANRHPGNRDPPTDPWS